MPHHAVYPRLAQDHVANKHAFGHVMKKNIRNLENAEQSESYPVKIVEHGGNNTTTMMISRRLLRLISGVSLD